MCAARLLDAPPGWLRFEEADLLRRPLSFCLTCVHFKHPMGPQGHCEVWQKAMTAAEASIHRCDLWQARGPAAKPSEPRPYA